MIDNLLGTFLVLCSFAVGYWLRAQQMTVPKMRPRTSESESEKRRTRPKFDHSTPFSSILKNKAEKGGKGK